MGSLPHNRNRGCADGGRLCAGKSSGECATDSFDKVSDKGPIPHFWDKRYLVVVLLDGRSGCCGESELESPAASDAAAVVSLVVQDIQGPGAIRVQPTEG